MCPPSCFLRDCKAYTISRNATPNCNPGTNSTTINEPESNPSNTSRAAPMGGSTNANDNPFGHTVHGSTGSFSPSTHIHNNQCQHVNGDSYSGCNIYRDSPARSSSQSESKGAHRDTTSAAGSSTESRNVEAELEVSFQFSLCMTKNALNIHIPSL